MLPRNIKTLLLAVLCGVTWSAAADDFDAANRLYDEGKYAAAELQYGNAVGRGEWSANLFYNLGNTQFRQNAPGPAILSYERALALDPAHPEARANLQWVRERSGAKVAPQRWFEQAVAPVSTNALTIVAAVAAWLTLLACVLRRAWGWGVCAGLLAAYCVAGIWLRVADGPVAIIIAPEAIARLAPADRAAIAENLPAGSRVRVLSERGAWIYCALPGGGRGWLPAPQLEKLRLDRA